MPVVARPVAAMDLPQDVLDEIFGHLPRDDTEALRACSLVARPWVYPARRLLFSSVAITLNTYKLWKDTISPANTELLRHVRSLHYFARDNRVLRWFPPRIDALIDYMPLFCHLQSLTLCDMRVKSDFSEKIEIFSAFQHTLSSLSLQNTSLPWITFVALIDYFPALGTLEILDPFFHEDDQQQTPLSRPLHGDLVIAGFTKQALTILSDRLCGIQVVYDELAIHEDPISRSAPGHYQHLIDVCGKDLKRLKLSPCECTI